MRDEFKHELNDDKRGKVKTSNHIIVVAVIISLCIHITLFVIIPRLFPPAPIDKRAHAVEVWLAEPKQKPSAQQDAQKRTVVELTTKNNQQRPKAARYLAEHDQTAKKEKKALMNPGSNEGNREKKELAQDILESPQYGHKRLSKEHFLKKPHHGAKNADPLGIRYKPGQQGLSADDHIPDVETGDNTELNAWQWRHAPFFNRIKARIGQVWSPQSQISRYDPEGLLLGQKDRVTIMSVTLGADGELKKLAMSDSSGVAYLDEEAERAFKEAAPFPFPPKELFNEAGEFSFTFAFHLHINRGFSFDFDWQKDS